jgi:hypothetical protein
MRLLFGSEVHPWFVGTKVLLFILSLLPWELHWINYPIIMTFLTCIIKEDWEFDTWVALDFSKTWILCLYVVFNNIKTHCGSYFANWYRDDFFPKTTPLARWEYGTTTGGVPSRFFYTWFMRWDEFGCVSDEKAYFLCKFSAFYFSRFSRQILSSSPIINKVILDSIFSKLDRVERWAQEIVESPLQRRNYC